MAELATAPESPPLFRERPTEFVQRDAWALGIGPLVLAGFFGGAELPGAGLVCLGVVVLVACFFRNPLREIEGDDDTAVAPADGRVIAVDEVEVEGEKRLWIGIFFSIFNVHVNRAPLAGKVLSVVRGGEAHRSARHPRAAVDNARVVLSLETGEGERFEVVQIAGRLARRIVCHPVVGEWVERGARYGLIRFGARTDVVLPAGFEAVVARGERVRGGSTAIARRGGGE